MKTNKQGVRDLNDLNGRKPLPTAAATETPLHVASAAASAGRCLSSARADLARATQTLETIVERVGRHSVFGRVLARTRESHAACILASSLLEEIEDRL